MVARLANFEKEKKTLPSLDSVQNNLHSLVVEDILHFASSFPQMQCHNAIIILTPFL